MTRKGKFLDCGCVCVETTLYCLWFFSFLLLRCLRFCNLTVGKGESRVKQSVRLFAYNIIIIALESKILIYNRLTEPFSTYLGDYKSVIIHMCKYIVTCLYNATIQYKVSLWSTSKSKKVEKEVFDVETYTQEDIFMVYGEWII